MPKIPEETRLGRLERIVTLLRRYPDGLTEQEIASELNFDRRAVNNYLHDLELRGEIYKDGRYWYVLSRREMAIRRLQLNPEEAMTLYLAVRLLVKYSDLRNETAEQMLYKLATILSEDIGLGKDILESARQLALRPPAKEYESIYRTVMRAYIYRRKIAIRYQPLKGKPFETIFSPYLLEPSAIGYTVYAIGYSEIVGALRTYKLERIRSTRLLRESYTIPDDFPGQDLLRSAWSIFYGEDLVQVVLQFSPEVAARVKETNWHPSQQIEPDPDRPDFLRMTLQVAATTDLVPWIRGWGASCEVLAPDELRRLLGQEASKLAGIYAVSLKTQNTVPRYFAHSREGVDETEWQLLKDHLNATGELAAELAAQMGEALGIANMAHIAGLLHDIGKYSQEFQDRLRGSKKHVDHATAGAREIVQLFTAEQRMLAELLSYSIAGHHTGLPDYGSPADVEGDTTLLGRREKKKLPDYSRYREEIDVSQLQIQPPRLTVNRDHPGFTLSFLTRMLFSILVDADWLETERYMQGGQVPPRGQYASIEALTEQFNRYLERFNNPRQEINRQRTQTLNVCVQKASQQPGYFTLTVPTGGGKTLASMAFALNHAQHHGLRRVIYVLPFTSIIEQNAAVFRQALGELGAENVLEHHSNYDWEGIHQTHDDETNRLQEKLRLATENWDIPIVVTTNVQFFESLFASKKSQARKLHNIAKSVIIFDEVQLLPLEYLKPCMLAVRELVQNYGVTAVFCTATQPSLQRFFPPKTQFRELAPDPQHLFTFYRRVQVKNLGPRTDDEIAARLNEAAQALCIVNTRRHARGLFDCLKNSEGKFHLSTLMCPAHRKAKLREIRQRLASGLPCRVVSTSVMEAGIDVDFPVGYRALAGLDSIIQAAGRVNREMKQTSAEMFVFTPVTEFIKRTPVFVQQAGSVAQAVLRDHASDPTSTAAIEAYYQTLYNTLLNEHAFDAHEIVRLLDKGSSRIDFEFEKAAGHFKLIDQNTVTIIIPYDDTAVELVGELRSTLFPTRVLRHLQIYTVNVYEREFQNLQNKGVIQTIADSYHVLDETHMQSWYHPETGLILAEDSGGDAIFFDG